MNSDLPGDPGLDGHGPDEHPDDLTLGDLGQDAAGLNRLLRVLTSDGTAGELAGEQAALAMFRAHVPPSSVAAARNGAGPRTVSPATVGTSTIGAGTAAGGQVAAEPQARPAAARPKRPGWRLRAGGVPRLRIAVVSAAAVVGGFAAAAYASALPAPVQHIAYDAFHYIGVPDNHPERASGGPSGPPATTRPGQRASTSAVTGGHHPAPSASVPHSSAPTKKPTTGKPTTSASPTTSPSQGPPAGPAALSVQAGSAEIPAGTSTTISGQLTLGGTPDPAVYVRLMERAAGHLAWVRVDRAQTDAHGDVTFTTPALTANARFRLAYATGTRSTAVLITVVPGISGTLTEGAKGLSDYVVVSTSDARRGDVVDLQVLANGSWVTLKDGLLNASGRTRFKFSAIKWRGDQVQVLLLATGRHAAASFGLGPAPASAPAVAVVSTPVRPAAGGQVR
jgi:hypothetical protein